MMAWGVRPVASATAVALLLVIAGTYGYGDSLILVSLPALAVITYLGVRAPLVFYLILERRGRRPDTNLWRWGATAMIAAAAGLVVLTHRIDLLALVGIEVNLLYASAKLGCISVGCCAASPRWRHASINLPTLEAVASLTFGAGSTFLLVGLNQLEFAFVVAIAGYLAIRLLSYAARAEHLSLREAGNTPDLIAAALVVLVLTATLSYRGLLGA